jgi:glutathione peroxidase
MATPIEEIHVRRIDGQPSSLAEYAGKVRLIVNVASQCGLTPQYAGLEALYRKYHARGFEILAFPANEFGAQEPGSEAEIQAFCFTNYGISVPLFSKLVVKGPEQHPLYAELTAAQPEARAAGGSDLRAKLRDYGFDPGAPHDVLWNFEKFLVNRRGEVVDRFAPDVLPEAELIVSAIEHELERELP